MKPQLTAYARAMGITAGDTAPGEAPLLSLEFSHDFEGRPGAWHGGAIAGLLETAGYAVLRQTLAEAGRQPRLKPINVTVQYLSAGRPQVSHARGRIVKLGRRTANIAVEAWQDDPSRPMATAVMNVLMVGGD